MLQAELEEVRLRVAKAEGEFERQIRERTFKLKTHQLELEAQNEELRIAQQQLEASRRRFADLYDFAPIGYFSVDREGLVREVNLAGASLLGVNKDELLEKPFSLFIHEDDGPRIFRIHIQETFSSLKRQVCELKLRRNDGSFFNARLESILSEKRDDKAGQIWMAVSDITGQKNMEQDLRQSETRFRTLSHATFEGIAISESGCVVEANEQFALMHGYSPGEVIGMPVERFLAPNDRGRVLESISGTDEKTDEYNALKKDGSIFFIEAHGRTIGLDGRKLRVTAIRDMTEHKRIQRALEQSVNRFELLARTAAELLQTRDPQRVVESVCKKVIEYLGCDVFFNFLVEEKTGKLHLNSYAGVTEEDARKTEWLDYGEAVCGCVARDGCRIVAEHIPTTPDSQTELIKSYGITAYACHPLLSLNGRVIGTLSFGTRSRQTFSGRDLELMKAVADQVAIAMVRMSNEAALRESEERYRLLVEVSPDAIMIHDGKAFLFVNSAAARLLGFPGPEQLIGRDIFSVLHPDFHEVIRERIAAMKSAIRILPREIKMLRFDGTAIDVESMGSSMVLKGREVFQIVIRDITERKRGEELIRSTALFPQENPNPVLRVDKQGQLLFANRAAAGLLDTWQSRVGGRVPAPAQQTVSAALTTGLSQEWELQCGGRDLSFVITPIASANYVNFYGRDITERRRAEEAIQQSNRLLDAVVNSTHLLMACLDSRFNFIWVNRAYAESDEKTPDYFRGKNHFDLYPNEENEAIFRSVVETAKPFFIEAKPFEYKGHPERGVSYWDWGLVPLVDKRTGNVDKLVFTLLNITGRKQAEQQIERLNQDLQRRVAELETIFKTVPIGLSIAEDPEGSHIRGNRANELMLGVPEGGELSKRGPGAARFKVFQDGRELAVEKMPMQRAVRGEMVTGQIIDVVREDGRIISLLSAASPLLDEQRRPRGAVGAFLDITALKRAEAELRRERDKAQQYLDIAGVMILALDTDQKVVLINQKGCEILGYPEREIIGKNWFDHFIHSRDAERVKAVFNQIMCGNIEPLVHYENPVMTRNGSLRIISWHNAAVRDESGNIACLLSSGEDITERKRAEEELIRLNEKLEARVRERTEDLAKTIVTLEREAADRKRAEEAVKVERQRFNAVLETLPAYLVLLTLDYHIAFANRFFRERFGDSHGRRCFEYLFERTEPCDLCETYKVLRTNAPHQWEWTGPDGRNYHIYDFPFIDSDGSTLIMEMGLDITEHKRAEQALRESEVNLAKAQSIAHIGSWTYDLQSEKVSWSDELYNIFNLDPLEFKGDLQQLIKLVHAEDRNKVCKGIEEIVTTSKVEPLECRINLPDGRKRVVWAVAETVCDREGKLVLILGTVQDITERKRAEEELTRLATAVESAADALVVTDPVKGLIQYVNPAFEKITGYSREEVIGRDLHLLESGRHDEEFFQKLRETLKQDGVWTGRMVHKKKDGSLYDEECTYSPVKNASGEIINYISIKRDVTEKVRLESIAQAVETMNNVGYIFAGVSHEIGNPVNTIRMNLDIMKKRIDLLPKEKIAEYLDRMAMQVSRVEYLLKGLKNFNMYESLQPCTVEVSSFLKQFLPMVKKDFETKGIMIETRVDPDADRVYADPRALQQVLLNILTNSSDALEGRESPKIVINVSTVADLLKICVKDNGRGIEEGRLKDLFKPFHTTKKHGTGLGLVIIKKMIARMNGTVTVTSRINEGTIVEMCLPQEKSGNA